MHKTYYNTLNNILEDNKNTEYGKSYNFSQINTFEEYKKNVPISDYSNFKSYIDKMYNGEINLLTSYQILTFNQTSGTEGMQKLIPITKKSLDTYSDKIERNKNKTFKEYIDKGGEGKRLFIDVISIDSNEKPYKKMIMSEIYCYNLNSEGYINTDEYIGGKDLMFDPDTKDYLYEKVWCAILEENIILIESAYMYDILQFFNMFENHYKEIISDIRNGRIDPNKKISEKAKKFLLNMKYSEERLNWVEKECKKGFEGIAGRIWKNLKLVSGITSKLFIYENNALDKFIGNIPKDAYLFGASEGMIGTSLENNNYSYYLEPSFGFYEFIPYSENEDENNNSNDTIDITKVEKDKIYELVLTNLSGLYRYKTGDLIKIVNNDSRGVFFEFFLRKNLLINIAGEKTNYYQIERVMKKMNELIPNILEFSLGSTIFDNVGVYFLFLSLPDNQKNMIDLVKIKKEFDLMLCKGNCIYEHLRELNLIEEPKIFLIDKEEYSKMIKVPSNVKCHHKPKFILSEQFLNRILINFK